MRQDSKLINQYRIVYNGDYIISRHSLELVRVISGLLLLVYVIVVIMVQSLGARDIVDEDTVKVVQAALDVPTMLVLVVYAGLTIRQELFKPKYNVQVKKRPLVDLCLIITGAAMLATLLLIKYWA